jgi:nucleotidyltransferase/DNA polymerase involved in DNA repair
MSAFCRDCLADAEPGARRCKSCNGHRILAHDELDTLAIAHLDCDAFYAAIEKRDNPSLVDKPVIIGGGVRGVVSTACYIARISGVKSAMPMFQARRLCPHAVIIKPSMAKYAAVGREVRALMRALTPLVEPLSLDEAYLDLSGTAHRSGAGDFRLHRPQLQQVPRQARLRTRQAARLRRHRPLRSQSISARQAGGFHPRGRQGAAGAACEGRDHPHRAAPGR